MSFSWKVAAIASFAAAAEVLGGCGASASPDGLGTGGAGGESDGPGSSTVGPGAGPGSTSASSSGAGGGSAATGSGGGGGLGAEICERWTSDRVDLAEGTWSGSTASCDAGDVSQEGRANAVKLVNLYRFLAGLPEVADDADRDQKAQACALMMDANGALSHTPPADWVCYSDDGATAAGSSNISPTPGVAAVDLYMADPGNDTTIGHRRWILSGSLGPIGIGSTASYSCMWVVGGNGNLNPDFTAWPPAGPFPIQAMTASFAPIDTTGWTIQSSVIDLDGAQVTIHDGNEERPVEVTSLGQGY